eukprot:657864-Pleurochrysis_carterae.AAC.1
MSPASTEAVARQDAMAEGREGKWGVERGGVAEPGRLEVVRAGVGSSGSEGRGKTGGIDRKEANGGKRRTLHRL